AGAAETIREGRRAVPGPRFSLNLLVALTAAACSSSSATPVRSSDGGGSAGGPDARAITDGGTAGEYDARPAMPPLPLGSRITTVVLSNESGRALTGAFVTFAQPFRPHDVPAGATVAARSGGQGIALQVDAKARHADGSLRHAVLTALVPSLGAGAKLELELVSAPSSPSAAAVTLSGLLATSYETTVSATLGPTTYTASVRGLLAAGAPRTWLSGPLVTEWTLAAPLVAAGTPHPHLAARFDVRAYAGARRVDVSVTVENDWAYEAGPQNFTYDAAITTDHGAAFSAANLVHHAHARWRRTIVWGDDTPIGVRHDPTYLMATGAVPSYDPEVAAAEPALAELAARLTPAA